MKEIELILPLEGPKVDCSLEELEKITLEREGIFNLRLKQLARKAIFTNRSPGWQKIIRYPDGWIEKIEADQNEQGSMFTGNNFCLFASYALRDGLALHAPHISYNILTFDTIVDHENIKGRIKQGTRNPHMGNHCILSAYDSDKAIFFDPTYGQIYHPYAGSILIRPMDLFDEYYQIDKSTVEINPALFPQDYIPMGLYTWDLADLSSVIALPKNVT